ncbi:MAG TPA: hypothetical protein VGE55_01470 [Limnobacter sp.]|uniref:hypothetical protein n=1 Tax=Limnobacter sp. TaxID=2003368 RepID=UPI002ED8AD65
MTPTSPLGRLVHQHRASNHVATVLITLCAGGVGTLLITDQPPTPNRAIQPAAAPNRFPPKRQTFAKPVPVFIFREQQDTESAAWSSTFNWMAQHRVSSGRCTLKPDANVVRIQCVPSEAPVGSTTSAPWQALDVSPAVFKAVRDVQSGSRHEPVSSTQLINNQENNDAVRQQGWVDTQQGKRHYDAKKHNWLAPGKRP